MLQAVHPIKPTTWYSELTKGLKFSKGLLQKSYRPGGKKNRKEHNLVYDAHIALLLLPQIDNIEHSSNQRG